MLFLQYGSTGRKKQKTRYISLDNYFFINDHQWCYRVAVDAGKIKSS